MPALTLEAIRQNPWNVLTHELPENPSRLLLTLAQLAATFCREIEYEIYTAAEVGEAQIVEPNRSLDGWSKAHRKIGEIIGLLEDNFGVAAYEIMLSRNST
jgi:hypothetical protein